MISLHKMSKYPETDCHIKNKVKVELDLSNYTAKSDLEKAACGKTSEFARKI